MKKPLLMLLMFLTILVNVRITFADSYYSSNSNEVQRVRVDFTSSQGYTRHLLLGFTPNNIASDGFDYGFDAPNIENHPDDLNWLIEDNRYVIQGVGSFSETKAYPFGMYIGHSGDIEISLNSLENFNQDIEVFIYDSQTNIFYNINDSSLTINMLSGNYENRFYITFTNSAAPEALSIAENSEQPSRIYYNFNDKNLIIETNSLTQINAIRCYAITGQEVISKLNLNSNKVDLFINTNSPYLIVSIKTNIGIETKKIAL